MSKKTGSKIYGKAEFQNPGGSVKDRAALGVVKDAEASGRYVLELCMAPFCCVRNSHDGLRID